MQERLPLRPSELVRVWDGYIAFLKQPAGTATEAVIPPQIIGAMTVAARRDPMSYDKGDVVRFTRDYADKGQRAAKPIASKASTPPNLPSP